MEIYSVETKIMIFDENDVLYNTVVESNFISSFYVLIQKSTVLSTTNGQHSKVMIIRL